MIYVQRDGEGRVVGVSHGVSQGGAGGGAPSGDGWTSAPPDDPAVVAFATRLGAADSAAHPLVGTDLAMARVLEDLINLLLDQSVIRFTDLPAAAQAKLLERQNTRAAISRLRLMADTDPENREII